MEVRAKWEKEGRQREERQDAVPLHHLSLRGSLLYKSRDITLPIKVRLVKAMVFPVVMYGCESWTVKKAERQRIDDFELWCWGRLLSKSFADSPNLATLSYEISVLRERGPIWMIIFFQNSL